MATGPEAEAVPTEYRKVTPWVGPGSDGDPHTGRSHQLVVSNTQHPWAFPPFQFRLGFSYDKPELDSPWLYGKPYLLNPQIFIPILQVANPGFWNSPKNGFMMVEPDPLKNWGFLNCWCPKWWRTFPWKNGIALGYPVYFQTSQIVVEPLAVINLGMGFHMHVFGW